MVMASLEKHRALLVYDHDDYFGSGIQPISLCNILELELRSQNLWMDQTLPLLMGHVVNVATRQLEQAAYQPQGRDLRTKSVNLAELSESSDEDTDSKSSNLKGRAKKKKGNGKKEEGVMKDPKPDKRGPKKPEPV